MSKVLSIYADLIANTLTDGNLLSSKNLPKDVVRFGFDKFVTSKGFRKIYNLTEIEFPEGKSYVLFELLQSELTRLHPECRTFLNILNKPAKAKDFLDEKFKKQLQVAYRRYLNMQAYYDSLDPADRVLGKRIRTDSNGMIEVSQETVEVARLKYQNFEDIANSIREGNEMADTCIFVEVSYKDRQDLKDWENTFERMCRSIGIKFSPLFNSTKNYLNSFSAFSNENAGQLSTGMASMLVPGKTMGQIMPYGARGLIEGKRVYVGHEVGNQAPFLADFKGTSAAQNILIADKTGGGKTVLVKNMINYHILDQDHVSILDYKGNEYVAYKELAKAAVVDFSAKDPQAVQMVVLSNDEELSPSDNVAMSHMQIEGCARLCAILARVTEEDFDDVIALVKSALNHLYSKSGVDIENPRTYYKSESLTYNDLLGSLVTVTDTPRVTEARKHLVASILERLEPYFKPDGANYRLFAKSINFKEIVQSQVVIFNFNKNQQAKVGSTFSVEDMARLHMMSFINSKKNMYLKGQKKYLVEVYEELQRASEDSLLMKIINSSVTGGRSDNKITYLITNSLGMFSRQSPDTKAVASNITTFLVGGIDRKDTEFLKDLFYAEELYNMVREVNSNKEKYKHSFAMDYNNGKIIHKCILRAVLSSKAIKHPLFISRDEL